MATSILRPSVAVRVLWLLMLHGTEAWKTPGDNASSHPSMSRFQWETKNPTTYEQQEKMREENRQLHRRMGMHIAARSAAAPARRGVEIEQVLEWTGTSVESPGQFVHVNLHKTVMRGWERKFLQRNLMFNAWEEFEFGWDAGWTSLSHELEEHGWMGECFEPDFGKAAAFSPDRSCRLHVGKAPQEISLSSIAQLVPTTDYLLLFGNEQSLFYTLKNSLAKCSLLNASVVHMQGLFYIGSSQHAAALVNDNAAIHIDFDPTWQILPDSDKKDTFADNLHNQIREAMLGCGYDIVVEDEYNMVFTTQPSPEPALSQQRLRGTAEAGRNWVLGAGSNLLRVDAQRFMASLLMKASPVNLVLFVPPSEVSEYDSLAKALLGCLDDSGRQLGSTARIIAMEVPTRMTLAVYRYILYSRFVQDFVGPHDVVVVSDVRDVVFQGSPFEHVRATGGIQFYLEGGSIGGSEVNKRWLEHAAGFEEAAKLMDKPVSCSGYTSGVATQMAVYLAEMSTRIEKLSPVSALVRGVDQGIHNFILHSQSARFFGLAHYENSQGVYTMHTMIYSGERFLISDKTYQLANRNSQVVPVVHQYDRYEPLRKMYTQCFIDFECLGEHSRGLCVAAVGRAESLT